MNVAKKKREVSILIPYRLVDNRAVVYLQKREPDAARWPDYFGFFGGGREPGEDAETALRREIQEELSFAPVGYEYFRRYEFENSILDVFILAVSDDFENRITVMEGEYGRWFTEPETVAEPKLTDHNKLVLPDVYRYLKY
ncbi:MAG: NUDIX domain-containing protein [Patescibacteria group bacterium]